jgi:hypothetical protein
VDDGRGGRMDGPRARGGRLRQLAMFLVQARCQRTRPVGEATSTATGSVAPPMTAPIAPPSEPARPMNTAEVDKITEAALQLQGLRGAGPPECPAFISWAEGLRERDPWGNRLRGVCDDAGAPRLVSAGPDGIVGTADDMVGPSRYPGREDAGDDREWGTARPGGILDGYFGADAGNSSRSPQGRSAPR